MAPFEIPLSSFHFPPGVRFHPSDEELIVHYLLNKVNSHPLPAAIIAEVELYNYNPWDLPRLALFGEDEWFFFSPRDRKYPNGVRPNRTTSSGYWKATGTDKPILSSIGSRIGVKKALVFYTGKAPKGVKTDWIMIEYRLPDRAIQPSRSAGSMRLDDWVLCRIRQKGNMSKNAWKVQPSSSGHPSSKEELPSVYTNHTIQEFYSNYYPPYKDCPTFSTQVLPSIEDILKVTSQISNGGNTGFYYAKRNPNEGNGYESLHQATKITHEKETNNILQVNNMIMGDGTGFYNQYPSHLGDVLEDISSNTIVNCQGLSVSGSLPERFLQ